MEQALDRMENDGAFIPLLLSICDVLIDALNSYSETAMGFQDTRHFSRGFKRACGMLPTDFRAVHAGRSKSNQ